MSCSAINRHVPPDVMVVVVVVFMARDVVNNMGIPFDLSDTGGEKNCPPEFVWRAIKVVRLISVQRLTTLLRG